MKLVSSFLSGSDAIGKMSTATGISTTTLQEWAFAAEQSGTDINTVRNGVNRFARVISDASNGSMTATRSLEALGLSAEELGRLTPEEQMNALADAVAGVEDPTQRTALAQEVLGRAGADLIPFLVGGADGLRDLGVQAHEAGRILDEDAIRASERTNDAMNIFNSSLKGVVNQGIAALLPAIEGLATFLSGTVAPFMTNTLIPVMQRLIEDGFAKVSQAVEDLQPVFEVVWEVIQTVVGAVITGIITRVNSMVGVFRGVIDFVRSVFAGDWEGAWNAVRNIFANVIQGLLSPLEVFLEVLAKVPFVGGAAQDALDFMRGAIEKIKAPTDAAEDAVDDMNTAVTNAVKPLEDMQFELGVTGQVAVDAANDIDDVSRALIGVQSVTDKLKTEKARAELFALAAAQHAANAAARGDDPFIAAQEALDTLAGIGSNIRNLTNIQATADSLVASFTGSQSAIAERTARSGPGRTGTGDDTTPDARETPEQRFTRLLEEQQIRLLNQGISGGSLDLLLGLFEDQLGLDDAGLRAARLAGGGKTAFESSLANFLRQRAERASDKADRDRDTARAADDAARAADKAAQDAAKLAADLLKEQNDKIDAQLKLQADLLREGFDSSTIVRLLRLFKEEVGLDDRALNSLRVVGGGRTAFEQALFDARNPAQEEEAQMAKAVAKGVTMANEQAMRRHVCVPSELNAHETVLNLESPARRGTTRSSLVLAEGLC